MNDRAVRRRSILTGAGALAAIAALRGSRLARAEEAPPRASATAAAGADGAAQADGGAASAKGEATRARMRFGITTPPEMTWDDAVLLWQEAERVGFDSAFVFDHPMLHRYEAWTLLSALSTQTTRLRMGVLVSASTYRNPAIVTKMATTIDHVSRGRAILGLGAGWLEKEFLGFGIPFYDAGERARRLAEAVEIAHRLFTQPVVDYDGKYYDLKGGVLEPKPVQNPLPILVGGLGPKVVLPAAARHAQIWHFILPGNPPDKVRALCAQFDAICREVGRDPKEVEKASSLNPGAMTLSPADKVKDEIRMFEAAGVKHLVLLPPITRETVRQFAEQVMPDFRQT